MILGKRSYSAYYRYDTGGVVIGEHGFHILERDSSFELFGKVGLYYIMFLAGLEMDMGHFKKNRTKALCSVGYFSYPDGGGHMEQHEYVGLWVW